MGTTKHLAPAASSLRVDSTRYPYDTMAVFADATSTLLRAMRATEQTKGASGQAKQEDGADTTGSLINKANYARREHG